MLDWIEASLILLHCKSGSFQQISFLVYTFRCIVPVNVPSEKSWHNFPGNNFLSSLYKFFCCVHHCNILGYFQRTWITSVMSLLSPPLLRDRSVHSRGLCQECFWVIMLQTWTWMLLSIMSMGYLLYVIWTLISINFFWTPRSKKQPLHKRSGRLGGLKEGEAGKGWIPRKSIKF